jgi:phosphoadenosine phosphosulfate reductase
MYPDPHSPTAAETPATPRLHPALEALDLPALEALPAEELARDLLLPHSGVPACITCSFQAEDMIVVHLLRQLRPAVPVLFLETGYHFADTRAYRDRMAKQWDLAITDLQSPMSVAEQESQFGILHRTDPTRCCQIRKVEPLMRGLEPFDLWFTGLRREQSPSRAQLRKLERHQLPGGKVLLKVSLLADWTWRDVQAYTKVNEIPYLPLYDAGYQSIGCEPCTALPADPNNPRSGRWGGAKLECGIHTFSEKQ